MRRHGRGSVHPEIAPGATHGAALVSLRGIGPSGRQKVERAGRGRVAPFGKASERELRGRAGAYASQTRAARKSRQIHARIELVHPTGSVASARSYSLEVARAVVACVFGGSPSVRVGGARVSLNELEGAGDPGAPARGLDPAPPRAAPAAAPGGPGFVDGAESLTAPTHLGASSLSARGRCCAGTSALWRAAGCTRVGGRGGTDRWRGAAARPSPRARERHVGLPPDRR
jgi:hypothetical protein